MQLKYFSNVNWQELEDFMMEEMEQEKEKQEIKIDKEFQKSMQSMKEYIDLFGLSKEN